MNIMNPKPVIDWVEWIRGQGIYVPAIHVPLILVRCVQEGGRVLRGIPLDDEALNRPLPYAQGERRQAEDG